MKASAYIDNLIELTGVLYFARRSIALLSGLENAGE